MPSAVLIEDEALPRAALREYLAELWPELQIQGEAEDGATGLALIGTHRPDIAFVDIRLPGALDGIALARAVASRVHLVFVTAFEQHALQAFEQGAVDYLLKPLQPERLVLTVQRLRERLSERMTHAPADLDSMLRHLQQSKVLPAAPRPLRWLQVGEGEHLRLVTTGDVLFFRADTKYTQAVTQQKAWLLRLSLKELLERLDADQFWQVHRSAIVNLAHIERVERSLLGHMHIHFRSCAEVLSVSQSFQARFKQM